MFALRLPFHGEQFEVHAALFKAVGDQPLLDGFGHGLRAAQEGGVQVRGVQPAAEDGVAFVRVDAAVIEVHVLLFAAEHIDDVEPAQVGVFQVAECFAEQGGATGTIAVDQGELAVGFGFQRGLDDRQDRRDAAAGGHRQVVGFALRVQVDVEVAGGRHHFQGVAFLEFAVGEAGEAAAGDFFYRHAQVAVVDAGADGVGAAHFFAVHMGAHDQVLALGEAEGVVQFRRHVEGDGHRFAGFRAHFADCQRVELGHGFAQRHLK